MPIVTKNRLPDYADLDLTFTAHPITGDVPIIYGDEAIKRSVKNLILTNFWERPFRSFIGSNAQKQLFENINPLTANLLKDAVEETINNFEPRISKLEIIVKVSPDSNAFLVGLKYIIANRLEPIIQTMILQRIR